MRVTLTKNLNKQWNFVNGMSATVTHMGCNDDHIIIHGEQRRAVYFPLRLGYSTTLMKVQGSTLEHITFWYDVLRVVPAA
eukprot:12076901-Karenia_brevis.AAC.1